MTRTKPLNRTPLKRKPRKKQPGDNPRYLAWIRTLPCLLCWARDKGGFEYGWVRLIRWAYGQKSRTEPHHAGDHGYAQLPPDRTAIPLCAEHHRTGKDAAHVLGKNFWKHHNLDRDQIIRELNERYNQLHV